MRAIRLLLCALAAVRLLAGPPPASLPKPVRIVSQTVGSDELLMALCPKARIAALSHIADNPEFSADAAQAAAFPHLASPDAESVLRFKPDLVIVASYTRKETIELLKRSGVRVFEIEHFDRLEDIYANIRALGAVLGEEAKAEALVKRCQDRVADIQRRLQGVRPVRVLSASIYGFTAGRDTTFQDLCEHAGATNVAAEAGLVGHPPTPDEKVLAWNPEVLVVTGRDRAKLMDALGRMSAYRFLPALRQGRLATMPEPLMSSVSHHRIDAYEALAKALHPERFK